MDILESLLFICLAYSCIQDRPKRPHLNLENYLGTEKPYQFYGAQYTPPPPGYTPVYINHLGRHGARYLTGDEAIDKVYKLLLDAKAQGGVTKEGEMLLKDLEQLMQVEEGKYGLLTPSGLEMEQGIARRMYSNFPEVFGKRVLAVSTYALRTKESMHAFLDELGRYTSDQNFYSESNGKVDPILRFFDLNTEYLNYKKDGDWKEEVKIYEARQQVSEAVLKQFFTYDYLQTITDQDEIATDIYSFYTNQFDAGVNAGLGEYFTPTQLEYYWENKNLSTYLEKGPSNIGQNLPTNIAFALLADFLITTEQAIKSGNTSANLRFAHAETIIPFASILKLPGYWVQTDDLGKVAYIWQDYEVAPMAANIQWILYKNKESNDYLIKVLYNEQETILPLESDYKPYYKWDDVKKFYLQVLDELNLDINKGESLVQLVKDYKVE